MKTSSSMCVCAMLAACGGSRGAAKPAKPADDPVFQAALRDALGGPAMFAAVADLAPKPKIAAAYVYAVEDGAPIGVITFEPEADGVILISGDFSGLGKSTKHAFYIHQWGNCADNGTKVGGHLNPTEVRHGPPASRLRHAGDFGDLTTDANGKATFSMRTNSVTLEERGPNTVIDRAVVIHADPDSKRGDSGPALACGVIELVDAI